MGRMGRLIGIWMFQLLRWVFEAGGGDVGERGVC